MAERLIGVESEYALSGQTPEGESVDREKLLSQLISLAKTRIPHLPGLRDGGIFTQNGSRFYIDAGGHPEVCSPECTNPWDVVRYVLAGERILADLLAEMEREERGRVRAMLFKCNVDYSGTRATWGCHESFLHRAPPSSLPKQLIPHLVTRVIYTGAGGFNSLSLGLEFTLSPRVAHFAKVVSEDSTQNRGIFHTKDETLSSSGYHRLHLLCGESLASETGMWLKVGTTALVVALVEAGLSPGEGMELLSSLDAMRAIAADPTCRTAVALSDGRPVTAIGIQRHYLEFAEAHVQAPTMPPWAAEVCHRWRGVLDQLENDPESMSRTIDWAIKHPLYVSRARRHGFEWASLTHWTTLVERLRSALDRADQQDRSVTVDEILGSQSPIKETVRRLTPFLRRHGLDWAGLRPFLRLRRELFEIDTKFGLVGNDSIFTSLDRDGVLEHRLPGVDNVEQAIVHPPCGSRATVRGNCIRRFAEAGKSYPCNWRTVWDMDKELVLDLSDPFASQESWRGMTDNEKMSFRACHQDEIPDFLARLRRRAAQQTSPQSGLFDIE